LIHFYKRIIDFFENLLLSLTLPFPLTPFLVLCNSIEAVLYSRTPRLAMTAQYGVQYTE